MQPINYVPQTSNLTEELLKGYGAGLNFQGATQQIEMNAAREARAQELHPIAVQGAQQGVDIQAQQADIAAQQANADAARRAAYEQAVAGLAQKGGNATVEDYAAVHAQFPQLGAALMETFETLDDNRKSGQVQVLAQAAMALKTGNPDQAIALAKQYAAAAREAGDEASAATAEAMAKIAKTNPEAALTTLGLTLSALDKDIAARVFNGGSKVQSSVSVGNGRISVQTMANGDTRVVDTATNDVLSGQEAAEAIAAAEEAKGVAERIKTEGRQSGTNAAKIETGSQANAAEALGKKQADFVADALEGADKIATSVRNMETAINALEEGARAGAIDRYIPNISEASATLRNAMDRMGLDVIGSVTFGALSEGEMKLAMETAVPRNLDEDALKSWLAKKLSAQRRLRQALLEQAEFLSDPQNTLNDWTEKVGGGGGKGIGPSYLEWGD